MISVTNDTSADSGNGFRRTAPRPRQLHRFHPLFQNDVKGELQTAAVWDHTDPAGAARSSCGAAYYTNGTREPGVGADLYRMNLRNNSTGDRTFGNNLATPRQRR